MWDLIVSVPDHCLSFYFIIFNILPPTPSFINSNHNISRTTKSKAFEKATKAQYSRLLLLIQ